MLFKYIDTMHSSLFITFNKDVFDYIRNEIKSAKSLYVWGYDNIWHQPNKEFAHWFQSKGIKPDTIKSLLDHGEKSKAKNSN